ncbi:MAG TPA: polysaccharide biosynthesis/export family protein [Burkholderiaceae bacterium]|nr:polysaccharide biosynthesis/export family protein [Burkholderiaceae bacterium]
MINRWGLLGAVVAIGLLLGGCYTDFGPVAAEPKPPPPPAVASYIQLGDRVTITIYEEPNLSGVFDVNPDGALDLPLIGTVKVVGRTPLEVERTIAARYKSGKFLEQPKVQVAVVEYRPIYIFGEVLKPGAYSFRNGLNALTAVTEAGGITYRGSRSSVFIQHAGESVWVEYPLVASVTILPGDLIRIPERFF